MDAETSPRKDVGMTPAGENVAVSGQGETLAREDVAGTELRECPGRKRRKK